MNIEFYRPLWGRDSSLEQFAREAHESGFAGIEGHLPDDLVELQQLRSLLKQHELKYIGEICTGGSQADAYWVPNRKATVDEHLATFEGELIRFESSDIDINFINCMGGLDAWSVADCCRFFEQAVGLAEKYNYSVSFETHRTRCLYSPWKTFEILQQLPELNITADLSHWCVVAERMIDEEEGLSAIIPLTNHIHGRVGYDQGPQVPDPTAPEYASFVAAHQKWWSDIWKSQQQRGFQTSTMCTEYGPDGYLHQIPHTQEPVADLWQIMKWVANTERYRFDGLFNTKDEIKQENEVCL